MNRIQRALLSESNMGGITNLSVVNTLAFHSAKTMIKGLDVYTSYQSKAYGTMLSENPKTMDPLLKDPELWKMKDPRGKTLAELFPIKALVACPEVATMTIKSQDSINGKLLIECLNKKYNISYADPKTNAVVNNALKNDPKKGSIYFASALPQKCLQQISFNSVNRSIDAEAITPLTRRNIPSIPKTLVSKFSNFSQFIKKEQEQSKAKRELVLN